MSEHTCPQWCLNRLAPQCAIHRPFVEKDVTITARRGGKNLRVVEWFNAICPVGSHVLYWPGAREGEPRKSVTRSKAWLLGGHTPVVMVEGYAGGIALSHVMGYDPTRVIPPAEGGVS